MKYFYYIILIALILMSLAAGAAKVTSADQEVQFFASAGLDQTWVLPLGILQVIGGLAAAYHKTRSAGLAIVAIGFLASSIVIFITGNTAFGLVSLLPVALSLVVRARLPLG